MKHLLVASLLAASTLSFAQTGAGNVLGKVSEVRGIVTVSDGTSVERVAPGTPVRDRARFVSASTGRAELVLDNGCRVVIEENQAITVRDKLTCPQLLALIEGARASATAAFVPAATSAAAVPAFVPLAALGGALVAGGIAMNNGGGGGATTGGGGGNIPGGGGGGVVVTPPPSGQ